MLILAIVQGLTEFLPVSSSGHLVLAQTFLQARQGDIFFDVVLHLGTLGSVLAVYRREIRRLLRADGPAIRYVLTLVVGTLPAAAVGVLLKEAVEGLFHSPVFAAGGLLITAGLLFSTHFSGHNARDLAEPWEPRALPWRHALLIGCGQALAILPGISRSGATIATSLWLQVPRDEAARFSFLLSVPAICGALVLQISHGARVDGDWRQVVLATGVAFGVGLLALRWTALSVVRDHFWKFGVYCILVGGFALLVLR